MLADSKSVEALRQEEGRGKAKAQQMDEEGQGRRAIAISVTVQLVGPLTLYSTGKGSKASSEDAGKD